MSFPEVFARVIEGIFPRSVKVSASSKDLEYLGLTVKPFLPPEYKAVWDERIEGIHLASNMRKVRLLYRCLAHTDCRESIELGVACHAQSSSILAWVEEHKGQSIHCRDRPTQVDIKVITHATIIPGVLWVGDLWTGEVGYVL